MSCYNQEAGRYSLPTKEFARFKREFTKAWSERNKRQFAYCTKLVEQSKQVSKDDIYTFVEDKLEDCLCVSAGEIDDVMERYFKTLKTGRFEKPQLKALSETKLSKLTKDGIFSVEVDSGVITANSNNSTIYWTVGNNNNAVQKARSHSLGVFLFEFLNTVKWTKTTGGHVKYIDEHMIDNDVTEPDWNDIHGCDVKKYDRLTDSNFFAHI